MQSSNMLFTPQQHIYCLGMMIIDLLYEQSEKNKEISFREMNIVNSNSDAFINKASKDRKLKKLHIDGFNE